MFHNGLRRFAAAAVSATAAGITHATGVQCYDVPASTLVPGSRAPIEKRCGVVISNDLATSCAFVDHANIVLAPLTRDQIMSVAHALHVVGDARPPPPTATAPLGLYAIPPSMLCTSDSTGRGSHEVRC